MSTFEYIDQRIKHLEEGERTGMYVSIDKIVKSVMIDEGRDTDQELYQFYLDYALKGLREILPKHVAGEYNKRIHFYEIDATKGYVNLPHDFLSASNVFAGDEDGRIWPLREDERIGRGANYYDFCEDKRRVPPGGIQTSNLDPYVYYYPPRGFSMGGFTKFSASNIEGGKSNHGSYQIESNSGRLNFIGPNLPSFALLEYKFNPELATVDGNYLVHSMLQQPLELYVHWRKIAFKATAPLNRIDYAERKWRKAVMEALTAMFPINADNLRKRKRRSNRFTPKF